ncbi:alpha/beta fold hydrolase [Litorimonas haliclonae]|uniref:alpha/beta fold hydrolase n=1 Tax=Litorimonas haliclonae TaxID=2081977 RepID=UPI0039F12C39
MKYFLLTSAAVLALGACQAQSNASTASEPVAEQQAEKEIPKFSAEAFFQTTSYGLPSSAGKAFGASSGDLLVTSDESGIFNAYRLNAETGEKTQLTDSKENPISAVSWFPDDERFLYTSDGGGDELNHVYVQELDGSAKDLTPGNPVKASFIGWSDTGDSFFLMTNERDAKTFDVYRYQTEDYSREMIFENDGKQVDAISRDGRYLALTQNRTSADSDIYLVDMKSRDQTPTLITEHEGNISHASNEFSPNGEYLIYATDEFGEFTQAWQYNIETGEKSELLKADWDVSYVTYSPSGRYRVSGINDDGSTKVTIRDLTEKKDVKLNDLPEGNVNSVRFSAEEDQVAFIMNGDRAPSDIHVASLASGDVKGLTNALNPEISSDMLVEGEVVRYESYDRLEIPGILYKPHGASAETAVPALIMVHGGPGGQNRKGYNATIQHLVNNGYAVYAMNNRGSSGYGKTFFHMDDKKHGDVDLKDVIASKDFMAEYEWVDGERIGIIGGSYGGYMVAAALAFEPEEFDVGINIFGVTNWVRTLKSIPPWWESFRESLYDEMGDPATDEERHRAISPLFHAEDINKPLLVVQGANDPRVLQVESDELVEAVRKNDVPVEYIIFEDEGHGFRNKSNRIEASNAYVEFLDTYLKSASDPDPVASQE